jgi:DNA polymerase-3 subunit chi
MTQVDFYLLKSDTAQGRWTLACRLAEKAYGQGRRVYLHTASEAESQYLDQLLWTFRDGSFLPHGLAERADPDRTPILIGHDEAPANEHDVLINLAPEVPAFFSRFERVAEPLDQDPAGLDAGRARFRFYRDRGYPLQHHELSR